MNLSWKDVLIGSFQTSVSLSTSHAGEAGSEAGAELLPLQETELPQLPGGPGHSPVSP